MAYYNLFVYVVQAGKNGPIKVGSATDVRSRLSGLQSGHYEDLCLVATLPDPHGTFELAIHRHLADAHLRGEWFHSDHPTTKDLIRALMEERLPDWLTPRPEPEEFEPSPVSCACGWPVEQELADRGIHSCLSCVAEASAE